MDTDNLKQVIKASYAGTNDAEKIGQSLNYKLDRVCYIENLFVH